MQYRPERGRPVLFHRIPARPAAQRPVPPHHISPASSPMPPCSAAALCPGGQDTIPAIRRRHGHLSLFPRRPANLIYHIYICVSRCGDCCRERRRYPNLPKKIQILPDKWRNARRLEIFSPVKAIERRHTPYMAGKSSAERRRKIRRLGVLTFFKQDPMIIQYDPIQSITDTHHAGKSGYRPISLSAVHRAQIPQFPALQSSGHKNTRAP